MVQLPHIRSYGNYTTSNYGAASKVSIGRLTLYFSYETIVAFSIPGGLICSENVWSVTTGKHLNWIEPDKGKRVKSQVFEKALHRILKVHNF